MAVHHVEEDRESKAILTIAIVIGAVATVALLILLGSMFIQSSTGPAPTKSATRDPADVADAHSATSAAPFVSIKTGEVVYENSNLVRGSNGIFKSAISNTDIKEATLSERALLAQSARDIKAQGITNYTIETFDPFGMDEPNLKPKAGTVTAIQEFIHPGDASSIIFIYSESSKPVSSAISVPAVVGMTEGDARTTLKQANLRTTTIDAPNAEVGPGRVIFQSPEASRIMPTGGTVYLIVSR